jgi:hypothetical protein
MPLGSCGGNGADHCCYIKSKACAHLEENTVEGRRWACGLRRELGDWDVVLADPRYINDVLPNWEGTDLCCKTYPLDHHRCTNCGHGCN